MAKIAKSTYSSGSKGSPYVKSSPPKTPSNTNKQTTSPTRSQRGRQRIWDSDSDSGNEDSHGSNASSQAPSDTALHLQSITTDESPAIAALSRRIRDLETRLEKAGLIAPSSSARPPTLAPERRYPVSSKNANSPAIPTGQLRVRSPLSSVPGDVINVMPSAWDSQSPPSSEDLDESMEIHDQKLSLRERFGLDNRDWQDFRLFVRITMRRKGIDFKRTYDQQRVAVANVVKKVQSENPQFAAPGWAKHIDHLVGDAIRNRRRSAALRERKQNPDAVPKRPGRPTKRPE